MKKYKNRNEIGSRIGRNLKAIVNKYFSFLKNRYGITINHLDDFYGNFMETVLRLRLFEHLFLNKNIEASPIDAYHKYVQRAIKIFYML